MKTRGIIILAAAGLLVAPALAQPRAQEEPGKGRGLQPVRRRDRSGDSSATLIARIRTQLNLDEQQQAEFDRIVKEPRKKRGLGSQMKRQQALFQELRQAREAGDDERVAELRKELAESQEALRGGHPALELLDKIEHAGFLRDDQLEKLAQIRERVAESDRRGRGPGGRLLTQLDRLRGALKLTEEQAKQYDEFYAALREDLREDRADNSQTQQIIAKIMEAAEAGDTDRIKELREQLPNPRQQLQEAAERFLDQVEQILEPEQVRTLQRFRQRVRGGDARSRLQAMFRAVQRLDLDADQRKQLGQLERETHRAAREARRDPETMAQLVTEVQQELRDMLTDEQVAKFDKWLEREQSGKSGRGRAADRPRSREHRRDRPVERPDDKP